MERLLDGIKVIDLADEKAVFCVKLLGELGAGIIKVANLSDDPDGKKTHVFHRPQRAHAYLSHAGPQTGKSCAAADPADSTMRQTLRRAIAGADVLVESQPPGWMDHLGLGIEKLRSDHPGLVVASISGFGQSGPRRSDLSCDLIAAAMGGQAYVTGTPSKAPRAPHGEQTYYTASLFAAVGILAALHGRRQTGCGRHIDISLQEAALATLDHVMVQFFHEDTIAARQGSRHWDGLFALLPCRNGLIHLTPTLQWENLVSWLDSEGMAADLKSPLYQDDAFRRSHIDHILNVLAAWTSTHDSGELFELGQLMGFAWAQVAAPDQVIASPQLKARKFWRLRPGSDGALLFPGLPFRSSSPPADPLRKSVGARTDRSLSRTAENDQCHFPGDLGSPYPLQGLRVLDFTRVVAGPLATRMLADFGAQVIKVQTRKGAVGVEDNTRPYFSRWNRNKLSITLDMNYPEARALALDLAGVSDVVVENFSPRVMANWSLDYHYLRRIKPDIIMAAMSAMGHSGPWKDFTAFAATIHSLSGHTCLNGGVDVEPGQLGFAYADVIAGLYGALAVLAALAHRRRTGQGQFLDLSEYEAACTLLEPALLAAQFGQAPSCVNPYDGIPAAPYGCYPCQGQDRWCAIAVIEEHQWHALAQVLGRPRWMFEKRFDSMTGRKKHAVDLDLRLSRWTARYAAEDLACLLQRAGVTAGVVQTAADLAGDPHLAARRVFTGLDHPLLGTIPSERNPVRFTGEAPPWKPAPLLGQHNEYVFKELIGISDDVYEDYLDRGIIG